MHDSVGKTLYGIALSATALAMRVKRDAPAAAAASRDLASAAQVAAAEARELITDLRSDTLDLPLGAALRGEVERWSAEAGVPADFSGDHVDLPHPGTRYELFCVVREALRNVERHAGAKHVRVTLSRQGDEVSLDVADDGRGLVVAPGAQVRDLEPEGHFGLLGMGERATRVGGRLDLASAPGAGTTVSVRLPAADVRAREPWSPVSPTSAVAS
jgi:signal transduction histidine kinase